MQRSFSSSPGSAARLAHTLAPQLKGGEILALIGPLGSGKTTFSQALAKELGIKIPVTSPTFVLMNRYETSSKNKQYFYHLDLYRTRDFKEVQALGLQEIWGRPDTITAIEWADRIEPYLPASTIIIRFGHE